MKVLVDEMYLAAVAEALQAAGIESTTVVELRLARASDPEVFGAAVAGGYSMLTENVGDFTRIAAQHSTAGGHHDGLLIALSSRFSRRPSRSTATDRGHQSGRRRTDQGQRHLPRAGRAQVAVAALLSARRRGIAALGVDGCPAGDRGRALAPLVAGSGAARISPAVLSRSESRCGGMRRQSARPTVLRAWRGEGTMRLIDPLLFEDTSALLLEPCEPGTALSGVLPALDQDVVVAGLLRRLWIEPPPGHPFRPLSSLCDRSADEFEREYAAGDPRLRLDAGLAYTDLHPENILAAQREPWLAIDPKPHVGNPTYDALQHMLNHPDRLAADPAGFVRRMAELLDLDPSRLRDWLFARSVQESIDAPTLREVAVALRP